MSDAELKIPPVIVQPRASPLLAYQSAGVPEALPGWTGVKTFGYLPQCLNAAIQERLMWRGFTSFFMVLLVLSVDLFINPPDRHALPFFFGVFLVVMIPITGLPLWRTARRMKRQWPTFRLILSDQGVLRVCNGYPSFAILNEQIKDIREFPGTGLVIRGRSRLHLIFIASKYIENYDQIRAHLAAVHLITIVRRRWLLVARNLLVVLFIAPIPIGLVVLGSYSSDLRIEGLCFFADVAVCIWFTVNSWRNPNAMWNQKIGALILLLFPFVLLAKIVLVHWIHP